MRTLLASGTYFDKLTIYVVGSENPKWSFKDSRIHVRYVPTLDKDYWYKNKLYLCDSDADRVIFLDTDTMILSPIEHVYMNTEKDFLSRPAPVVSTPLWNSEKWESRLKQFGLDYCQYFTCGFMIFQNRSHARIRDKWDSITSQIVSGNTKFPVTRFAEQQALSITVAQSGLTSFEMNAIHHSYAMNGESYENAIVYHLGTPNFYHYYLPVENVMGIKHMTLPVRRPRFNRLMHYYSRFKHKWINRQ